jgi:predicted GNAT family N-acyltransferase
MMTVPVFSDLGRLAMGVRREVFVLEQGYAESDEFDALDATATQVVALFAGDVVGTLRIIDTDEHTKIGRVAVRATHRGRGIAADLMRFALAHARAAGAEKFWLSAQSDKTGFYERFGFVAYGEEYLDDGQPHRAMKTY